MQTGAKTVWWVYWKEAVARASGLSEQLTKRLRVEHHLRINRGRDGESPVALTVKQSSNGCRQLLNYGLNQASTDETLMCERERDGGQGGGGLGPD